MYDAPEVRIIRLAGLEAILNASAKGDLPDSEEWEIDEKDCFVNSSGCHAVCFLHEGEHSGVI